MLQSKKNIFVALAFLHLILFLPLLFEFKPLIVFYTLIAITSSFIFFILAYLVFKLPLSYKTVWLLILSSFFIRIAFVNTEPIGSDDLYRYMWDGKVQYSGINPYMYSPNDPKLISLHSEILPKQLNFQDMKTIYFPFSQWLFYLAYSLSGENVWGYKLLIIIADFLTLLTLILILKRKNKDLKFILLYAICPLFILNFSIDAHLDAFGLPLFLLSIYIFERGNIAASAFLLGLSISIKPVGLVLIPIYFLSTQGLKNRIVLILICALTFGIQFIPYLFKSNPFEAFLIYTKHWMYNGFVFNIINYFEHDNQLTRLITGFSLSVLLLALYFSKYEFYEKVYYAIMLLILLSPVVHPWYFAWLIVLLPVITKWSGIYLAAASSLTAITILNYKLYGVWIDYWFVLLLEYVPVLVLVIYELKIKEALKVRK